MKYLFLLYADAPMPEPGTPEARKLLEDWTEAEQAMAEAGVLIDCAAGGAAGRRRGTRAAGRAGSRPLGPGPHRRG